MTKITLTSYEGLRRWAEKQIGEAFNIWIFDKTLRDIRDAYSRYITGGCKPIEVED